MESNTVDISKKDVSGFFKYVFNFDDENKTEMLNLLQYTLLSIIPVIIILKGIRHFIPEDDETKGSLEILTETVGQIIIIILAIWFVNKAIRYIPTYSGGEYGKYDSTSFMIPFLILILTMQTKLGTKINILFDRVMEQWNGKSEHAVTQQKHSRVTITQPLAGQHQPSQADYMDHSQILPQNTQGMNIPTMQPQMQTQSQSQQNTDFNDMYHQQITPKPGAATPGEMMEPMAANSALGGFTSW